MLVVDEQRWEVTEKVEIRKKGFGLKSALRKNDRVKNRPFDLSCD